MNPQGCLKTGWRIFRDGLSVLLAALFALSASATLAGLIFSEAVLSPQNTAILLQQPGLIAQSRNAFASMLVDQVKNGPQAIPLLSQVPPETLQKISANLFSDAWIQTADSNTIHAVADWILNRSLPFPQVSYDLTPIKAFLQSSQGQQSIKQLIEVIPACTNSFSLLDLLNMADLTCIPAGLDLTPAAPIVTAIISNQIPDQVSFEELYQSGNISQANITRLNEVRSAYWMLKTWAGRGIWISLILLGLYVLLQLIPTRRLQKSSPYPFDAAGLFSLALIAAFTLFYKPLITWVSSRFLGGLAFSWGPVIKGFAQALARQTFQTWTLGAIGLLATGIMLHLLNLLIKKIHQHLSEKGGEM